MEAKEDQLPKSGVRIFMNTVEAFERVRKLQARRIRNERNLSPEDLSGKYRVPYEKLQEEIRQAQMEYRAACTRSIRKATEYLSLLILCDPTDEGIDDRSETARRKFREGDGDPLLLKILTEIDNLLDEKLVR